MVVELNDKSALEFNGALPVRTRTSPGALEHLALAFACFAFLYLYSNLGFALLDVWKLPLRPSYFYVVILIFAGVVLAISPAAIEVFPQHRMFILTLLAYCFLDGTSAVFISAINEGTQIITSNIEYALVTIAFLMIFSLCRRLDWIIGVVGMVVALSVGINLIEYYQPQLLPAFSDVPGRAAGFIENPNESAIFICLPLPLVAFFARRLARYAWYTIALAGTMVTFSRGGILLWATAVVVTEVLKRREGAGRLGFTGTFSLAIQFLIVGGFIVYVVSSNMETLFPYLDSNTQARMSLASDDNDRVYLAKKSLEFFFDAPFFGNGVGYTRSVSEGAHNTFIQILAEFGIVGGIWIASFLLSLISYGTPFGFSLVVMFSLSALFTHNHLEWPGMGMLFALYLVVANHYGEKDITAKKQCPTARKTPLSAEKT
jgi:hypothetical protein